MAIIQVEKALQDFAINKHSSAIVLKGEWGTGKTYIWNSVIKSHRNRFAKETYSYVSLFGLNSLSDLKRSIFENSVPTVRAGNMTTKETVFENIKKLQFHDAADGLRKLLKYGKDAKVPYVGSFGGVIDSIQYAMVKDTIICIDDFERRGNALSARDVLGLISNLIESKDCVVILILNEGSLQKDDEFFTFSEKVFDYEIKYAPTLSEAASVVFSPTDPYEKNIVVNVQKLGMNNIRLLRKVKYFADLIKPFVENQPIEILEECTRLIPLAIYAKYAGADRLIDIEDLEKYRGGFSLVPLDRTELTDEKKKLEEKKLSKESFFQKYGFGESDDFTAEIVKLVKNGYTDSESLLPLIDSIRLTIDKSNRRKKISDAWHVYNNDISVTDDALLCLFEDAIRGARDAASPNDMDGVFEIFSAVGLAERGKALVDQYFEDLGNSRAITNRKDIFKFPQSEYVASKLDVYFSEINKVWYIDELVDNFYGKPITEEVVELLSTFTVEQFYDYFKALSPSKFVPYAYSLLALGSGAGLANSEMHSNLVFLKTFEALKCIHDESKLMALRMNKFMDYQQMYDHKIRTIHESESHREQA